MVVVMAMCCACGRRRAVDQSRWCRGHCRDVDSCVYGFISEGIVFVFDSCERSARAFVSGAVSGEWLVVIKAWVLAIGCTIVHVVNKHASHR